MRQGVPVALALGIVVHAFPARDDQHCQRIADHVQSGARHVHDAVDASDERQAFQWNTGAAQGRQQHNEGNARYARDAFGGDHQGQHQHQLRANRQVDAVQLSDEDGCDALIERRTVKVERVARGHHETANRLRCAIGFHLLDHPWQHGFRAGRGVGQNQLVLEDTHQPDDRKAECTSDQPQHHEGEEGDGHVNQNHQLGERQQRGEAEVGDSHRNQGKHTNRRVVHDHVSDLEHGLRDALKQLHQRFTDLGLQAGKPQAEQHRKEDDRQHLATRHGGEDVGRDQVENGRDKRMIVLNFSRSLLILGNIDGAQCAHVDAGARMEHVGQHQPHQNRDSGHDFKIENGLETDTSQLLGIAHARDADDQRGDNDGNNDHLDQTNEDIACGLQDVGDPPGLFCAEMIE